VTVWPERDCAIPLGVTWSNRTSIHRRMCSGDRDRIKAARGKFKDRVDLLPRDVELLDDFFYGSPGFKVFEHGGNRHPGIAKYPCTCWPKVLWCSALQNGRLFDCTSKRIAAAVNAATAGSHAEVEIPRKT